MMRTDDKIRDSFSASQTGPVDEPINAQRWPREFRGERMSIQESFIYYETISKAVYRKSQ
jgi:hypothetical protein